MQNESIEELEAKLNEYFDSKNDFSHFFAIIYMNGEFFIELHESENFGYSIQVFSSEGSTFTKEIEEKYENGLITYFDAVIKQCHINISSITNDLLLA